MEFLTKLLDTPEGLERGLKFMEDLINFTPEILGVGKEYLDTLDKKKPENQLVFMGTINGSKDKAKAVVYIMEMENTKDGIRLVQEHGKYQLNYLLKWVAKFVPGDRMNEILKKLD